MHSSQNNSKMSYNTRRSGGFGPTPNQPPQQNVGSIGQRRPVVTNNFVPGGAAQGQLNQNKPAVPPMQRAPMAQTPNPNVPFRNQQPQQQQPPQNQGYQSTTAQPAVPPQVKPEPPTPTKNVIAGVNITGVNIAGVNPPNPALESANGEEMDTSADGPVKKKPFWARGGNKISKKEKMRRRNLRLSKMLQPKNAVMILNELVKNTSYLVDELQNKVDSNHFKATVLVEDTEHVGYGRSKIQAKNAAAETALKHYVKSNKLNEMKKDEEGNDEKMDVAEDGTQPPLPWQHVASFALFKLFCSWGEDPNSVKTGKGALNTSNISEKMHENKPAKKMPNNPETVNPLMLLNQMLPQAQFEEIGKSGVPPNVTFSFRCNVDGQSFIGTGPNKKAAKRLAAFGVCHKMLEVNYPTDVYVPIY